MIFTRLSILALSVLTVWQRGEAKDLDPSSVRELLLAEATTEAAKNLMVDYRLEAKWQGVKGFKRESRYHRVVRGPRSHPDLYCRYYGSGSDDPDYVEIRVKDEGYYVRRAGGGWTAWRGSEQTVSLNDFDPILRYLRPVENETWEELLSDHPPLSAVRAGEKLELLLPVSPEVMKAIRDKRIVYGVLGWRCKLAMDGDEYRLVEIDRIDTAEVVSGEKDGKVEWKQNADLIPGGERLMWPGRIQCGVATEERFSGFRRYNNNIVLPHQMEWHSRSLEVLSTATPTNRVQPKDGVTFAMRPPEVFGSTGVEVDLRTGKVFYAFGKAGALGMVETMLRDGLRAKERRRHLSDTRWSGMGQARLWILVGGGVILVVLVVKGARKLAGRLRQHGSI